MMFHTSDEAFIKSLEDRHNDVSIERKLMPHIADEDGDIWTEDVILDDGREVIAINIEYPKLDEWFRTMTDRVVIYVETVED